MGPIEGVPFRARERGAAGPKILDPRPRKRPIELGSIVSGSLGSWPCASVRMLDLNFPVHLISRKDNHADSWGARARNRRRLDCSYARSYICTVMQSIVFQTLADPTRLRIVEVLSNGEQAVNELVQAVDIDQSGVSRHLRILGEAGFVTMRPDGPRRLYSLLPEPFRAIDDWVGSYRRLWEGRLDRFGEGLKRRRSSRRRGGRK